MHVLHDKARQNSKFKQAWIKFGVWEKPNDAITDQVCVENDDIKSQNKKLTVGRGGHMFTKLFWKKFPMPIFGFYGF